QKSLNQQHSAPFLALFIYTMRILGIYSISRMTFVERFTKSRIFCGDYFCLSRASWGSFKSKGKFNSCFSKKP
ncbi:MAG: hypothetical protein RI575_18270, partial [Balneolaceae bacterium]|nr:hypothetical protein [Balneolaceae bacterium]